MHKTLAACAALVFAGFAAHAAEQVSMQYDAADTESPVVPLAGGCPVTIVSVKDMRQNKESVGSEFKPVASGDPAPWMTAALSNLKMWGFAATSAARPAPGSLGVSAELTRSYVWHGPMRLNGMVAMNVTYELPSGQRIVRKYRASASKNNWNNGTGEFMTTLNLALNNTLAKMATDLQKLCKG